MIPFSSCSFRKALISALLLLATRPLCQTGEVYYVTPNEEPHCHITSEPCHTLNYYAQNLNQVFRFPPQTIVYFLPGRHTLNGNHMLLFLEIEDLTLTGSDAVVSTSSAFQFESHSEVVCSSEGQAGFVFSSVNNLVIANLTFTSCGITVTNITAALFVLSDANITLLHTVIQNSTEIGLIVFMGASGSTLIANSAFLYNGGGGYLHLISTHSIEDDEGSGFSISIDSSVFMYGDPLGVWISVYYPCFPMHINVNNSKFVSNGRWQETGLSAGSHLFLHMLYSSQCRRHDTIIMITNSHFLDGASRAYGGGAFIGFSENSLYLCTHRRVQRHIVLVVLNNVFHGNNALNGVGGGLLILSTEVCQSYHKIEVNNVTFINNSAAVAGNMAIARFQKSTLNSFSV